MNDVVQTWQVMVKGELFESDLETLKQWVIEGAVQPTDKVRKGNLRWVDAGRTPALHRVFAGEDVPSETSKPAEYSTQTYQAEQATAQGYAPAEAFASPISNSFVIEPAMQHAAVAAAAEACCHNHAQTPPSYICRVCANLFCQECPKFVGASKIALCPVCGDLCQPYAEIAQKAARVSYQTSDFGWEDFKRALRYPLNHMAALLCGAAIYGLLLLIGFQGRILACAILFGCISHCINGVATGRLDRGFMPEFDMSSWWDEVGNPLLLSLGIIIVAWGPAMVLAFALLFGSINGSGALAAAAQAQQAKQQAEARTDVSTVLNPNGGSSQDELAAMRRLDPLHAAQYADPKAQAVQPNDVAAKPDSSSRTSLLQFLDIPLWAKSLCLIAFGWAVFYYPMALAVAGYTESFSAVINPLIGLDTIRRMGGVYPKAFAMYLCVQSTGIIIGFIVSAILSPFDLPFVGNLPAKFVNGAVTFYTSMVVAFILGLALYKCADKLDINYD